MNISRVVNGRYTQLVQGRIPSNLWGARIHPSPSVESLRLCHRWQVANCRLLSAIGESDSDPAMTGTIGTHDSFKRLEGLGYIAGKEHCKSGILQLLQFYRFGFKGHLLAPVLPASWVPDIPSSPKPLL